MAGTVFSRLAPLIIYNFALQATAAAVCVPLKTEKYYDLLGATGFLSGALLSLHYPWMRARLWEGRNVAFPALSSHAPRQLLLTGALAIWSARLGYFLFDRVMKTGKDSRFDEVKHQPAKFFGFWMVQAAWVTVVSLPVWLANAVPASAHPPLGPRDYIAMAVFLASFGLEATADRQKTLWKREKDEKRHSEQFITRGLWGWSRHPNYVGEVGIWTGIWGLSTAALAGPLLPTGAVLAAATSPLFTWFLVRNVSGVPPLEESGDKKWGSDPKWQEYKRKVPIFFPCGGH